MFSPKTPHFVFTPQGSKGFSFFFARKPFFNPLGPGVERRGVLGASIFLKGFFFFQKLKTLIFLMMGGFWGKFSFLGGQIVKFGFFCFALSFLFKNPNFSAGGKTFNGFGFKKKAAKKGGISLI